ncbi:hypothetical protein [Mycobacterium bourgelatii]|uniref:Transmembrane protein n=1 Tax=Mycobacterium bourgelatii TaxID=1273442 RepID=A0A7I9YYQ8_MYCBU|nr:hypothetical protein [Mycobacterium bourgelatii]MCV6977426.1 hypothetical protein [Mycobacterium bourgelatii]GFG93702.1 hypothetical protein MBOU_57440 [Mycobacterium bourgelatii]
MLVVGVLCICAALAAATFGTWSLSQPRPADPTQLALRAMAPTQLAAGVMLAAGGVVAFAAPAQAALVVVIICIVGAVGTLATGSFQSARYALSRTAAAEPEQGPCGGVCAACTLSCH